MERFARRSMSGIRLGLSTTATDSHRLLLRRRTGGCFYATIRTKLKVNQSKRSGQRSYASRNIQQNFDAGCAISNQLNWTRLAASPRQAATDVPGNKPCAPTTNKHAHAPAAETARLKRPAAARRVPCARLPSSWEPPPRRPSPRTKSAPRAGDGAAAANPRVDGLRSCVRVGLRLLQPHRHPIPASTSRVPPAQRDRHRLVQPLFLAFQGWRSAAVRRLARRRQLRGGPEAAMRQASFCGGAASVYERTGARRHPAAAQAAKARQRRQAW